MERFCIGAKCVGETSMQALVDSGSSFTYLPNDAYKRVTLEVLLLVPENCSPPFPVCECGHRLIFNFCSLTGKLTIRGMPLMDIRGSTATKPGKPFNHSKEHLLCYILVFLPLLLLFVQSSWIARYTNCDAYVCCEQELRGYQSRFSYLCQRRMSYTLSSSVVGKYTYQKKCLLLGHYY